MGSAFRPAAMSRLLSLALLASAVLTGAVIAETANPVDEAFNLRLGGKVDEAQVMLETHLKDNPNDAAAWYELARLRCYKITSGIGSREEVPQRIESAAEAIDKAVELEPDNVIYRYWASRVTFLQAYFSLQTNSGEAKKQIHEICKAFEAVLELKPDYGEVLLGLVELYGGLPDEMGADRSKAEAYAQKLEELDLVLGTKARAIMLPEGADVIEFWTSLAEEYPDNSGILEGLAKALLREEKADDGTKYLELAIKADPSRQILLLDLARYHGYRVMREPSLKESAIPLAEEALERYLETDPIAPIKAWTLNALARFRLMSGDKAEGEKLQEEAKSIDQHVSFASAIPSADLFVPPDELPHNHQYLFQPF